MGAYDRDYMRTGHDSRYSGPGGSAPLGVHRIVWAFIAISVVLFLLPMFGWNSVQGKSLLPAKLGAYWDAMAKGEVWRLITYQFVHGSFLHIICNMLMLFFVGREVVRLRGPVQFAVVYLVGGIAAALFEFGVEGVLAVLSEFGLETVRNQDVRVIGASGSVLALFAYLATLIPDLKVSLLLFFVIPIRGKMKNLALGFLAVSLVIGILSLMMDLGNIAHFAHAGGLIYGLLHGWYFDKGFPGVPRISFTTKKRRRQPRSPKVSYQARKDQPNVIDAQFAKTDDPPHYNDILDKINREGIQSLTAKERRILEQASEQMKKT